MLKTHKSDVDHLQNCGQLAVTNHNKLQFWILKGDSAIHFPCSYGINEYKYMWQALIQKFIPNPPHKMWECNFKLLTYINWCHRMMIYEPLNAPLTSYLTHMQGVQKKKKNHNLPWPTGDQ